MLKDVALCNFADLPYNSQLPVLGPIGIAQRLWLASGSVFHATLSVDPTLDFSTQQLRARLPPRPPGIASAIARWGTPSLQQPGERVWSTELWKACIADPCDNMVTCSGHGLCSGQFLSDYSKGTFIRRCICSGGWGGERCDTCAGIVSGAECLTPCANITACEVCALRADCAICESTGKCISMFGDGNGGASGDSGSGGGNVAAAADSGSAASCPDGHVVFACPEALFVYEPDHRFTGARSLNSAFPQCAPGCWSDSCADFPPGAPGRPYEALSQYARCNSWPQFRIFAQMSPSGLSIDFSINTQTDMGGFGLGEAFDCRSLFFSDEVFFYLPDRAAHGPLPFGPGANCTFTSPSRLRVSLTPAYSLAIFQAVPNALNVGPNTASSIYIPRLRPNAFRRLADGVFVGQVLPADTFSAVTGVQGGQDGPNWGWKVLADEIVMSNLNPSGQYTVRAGTDCWPGSFSWYPFCERIPLTSWVPMGSPIGWATHGDKVENLWIDSVKYVAVQIQLPSSLPMPKAVLLAPSTISSCLDIPLDASGSIDTLGSLRASWTCGGGCTQGVVDFLAHETGLSTSLPAALVAPGNSFAQQRTLLIRVDISNLWGMSQKKKKTLLPRQLRLWHRGVGRGARAGRPGLFDRLLSVRANAFNERERGQPAVPFRLHGGDGRLLYVWRRHGHLSAAYDHVLASR